MTADDLRELFQESPELLELLERVLGSEGGQAAAELVQASVAAVFGALQPGWVLVLAPARARKVIASLTKDDVRVYSNLADGTEGAITEVVTAILEAGVEAVNSTDRTTVPVAPA